MKSSKPKPLAPTVDLDPCTAVAERAAIAEFLAGMSRADAEAFALWDVSTIAERSRPAQLGLLGTGHGTPEAPIPATTFAREARERGGRGAGSGEADERFRRALTGDPER